ncbi:nitroreductase family protein [soil metagenome]
MDVFEAVRTLNAVRSYADRAVPDAALRRIVEAGRLTASASNRQPWHFIVVRDKDTLRKLGSLARTGPYVAEAPAAIAVAIERSPIAVSDASRAIQSMLLTAWSEGISSNWVGFRGLEAAKPVLGVPAELDLLALLPLGYAREGGRRGKKKRKTLAEIAHEERYGQAFR